jgi:hypothetical protein
LKLQICRSARSEDSISASKPMLAMDRDDDEPDADRHQRPHPQTMAFRYSTRKPSSPGRRSEHERQAAEEVQRRAAAASMNIPVVKSNSPFRKRAALTSSARTCAAGGFRDLVDAKPWVASTGMKRCSSP